MRSGLVIAILNDSDQQISWLRYTEMFQACVLDIGFVRISQKNLEVSLSFSGARPFDVRQLSVFKIF